MKKEEEEGASQMAKGEITTVCWCMSERDTCRRKKKGDEPSAKKMKVESPIEKSLRVSEEGQQTNKLV